MTNIEKINDLASRALAEMTNTLGIAAIDSMTKLIIAASNVQDEVNTLKEQNEALIKECDRLTNIVHEQGSEIINLRTKKYDADNNCLKEQNEAIINERNELLKSLDTLYKNYQSALSDKVALIKKIEKLESLVDLYRQKAIAANGMYRKEHEAQKENNKELKTKVNELAGMITINPCRDLEEVYLSDCNTIIKVKNLYLTNNYISEEDKNNE